MTNGEKFKTEEERFLAFREFCKDRACESCPCEGMIHGSDYKCMLKWLNLKVEEVILFSCPFCGGQPGLYAGPWEVKCKTCNAKSDAFDTARQAVAAWNRRVK